MTKAQIREQMKNIRNQLSKEEHFRLSRMIQEQLFATEVYQRSLKVFTFVSFSKEVDTRMIIERAIADQKKVYVPRVEKHGLEFYQIHNLNGLIPSKFGVPEPKPDAACMYSPSEHERKEHHLMVMPGLAFDESGNRIGYGAGYYDRYLARFPDNHFIKMAVAFAFQMIDHIPANAHDISMDAIILPTKIISCHL